MTQPPSCFGLNAPSSKNLENTDSDNAYALSSPQDTSLGQSLVNKRRPGHEKSFVESLEIPDLEEVSGRHLKNNNGGETVTSELPLNPLIVNTPPFSQVFRSQEKAPSDVESSQTPVENAKLTSQNNEANFLTPPSFNWSVSQKPGTQSEILEKVRARNKTVPSTTEAHNHNASRGGSPTEGIAHQFSLQGDPSQDPLSVDFQDQSKNLKKLPRQFRDSQYWKDQVQENQQVQEKPSKTSLNSKTIKSLFIFGACLALIIAVVFIQNSKSSQAEPSSQVLPQNSRDDNSTSSSQATPLSSGQKQDTTQGKIFVHISGQVHKPGIVEVNPGTRVSQALLKVGGTTREANLESINLAEVVTDGSKIHVPKIGETPPDTLQDASSSPSSSSKNSEPSTSDGDKININTASESELTTLPRIGPATAQKIITHRETNGQFKSVEDLTNVSGIGDKTLENLLPLITV